MLNKVILIGRLTKDPELKYTPSNVAVTSFTLAVDRRFARQGEERGTDFINIVVWRTLADNCHKFLKKGSKVGVVGNIQSRSYDATDGSKRYVTEVIAEEVEFISTKSSDGSFDKKESSEASDVTKLETIDDEGLPF